MVQAIESDAKDVHEVRRWCMFTDGSIFDGMLIELQPISGAREQ